MILSWHKKNLETCYSRIWMILKGLKHSTTSDTTTLPWKRQEPIRTSPSQRLEQQARLVCETLKALAISIVVMIIFVFGGAWIVQWLLVG